MNLRVNVLIYFNKKEDMDSDFKPDMFPKPVRFIPRQP